MDPVFTTMLFLVILFIVASSMIIMVQGFNKIIPLTATLFSAVLTYVIESWGLYTALILIPAWHTAFEGGVITVYTIGTVISVLGTIVFAAIAIVNGFESLTRKKPSFELWQ